MFLSVRASTSVLRSLRKNTSAGDVRVEDFEEIRALPRVSAVTFD